MRLPTPREHEYVLLHYTTMRDADKRAADAARKWRDLQAELKEHAQRNGLNYAQTRKLIESNWNLEDEASNVAFWTREVQRHAAVLTGMKAVFELLDVSDTIVPSPPPAQRKGIE